MSRRQSPENYARDQAIHILWNKGLTGAEIAFYLADGTSKQAVINVVGELRKRGKLLLVHRKGPRTGTVYYSANMK